VSAKQFHPLIVSTKAKVYSMSKLDDLQKELDELNYKIKNVKREIIIIKKQEAIAKASASPPSTMSTSEQVALTKENTRLRALLAAHLRDKDYSFKVIAEQLGVSPARASQLVQSLVSRLQHMHLKDLFKSEGIQQ